MCKRARVEERGESALRITATILRVTVRVADYHLFHIKMLINQLACPLYGLKSVGEGSGRGKGDPFAVML